MYSAEERELLHNSKVMVYYSMEVMILLAS